MESFELELQYEMTEWEPRMGSLFRSTRELTWGHILSFVHFEMWGFFTLRIGGRAPFESDIVLQLHWFVRDLWRAIRHFSIGGEWAKVNLGAFEMRSWGEMILVRHNDAIMITLRVMGKAVMQDVSVSWEALRQAVERALLRYQNDLIETMEKIPYVGDADVRLLFCEWG